MMYTHVERRRRSIICRPAAQGDHRGGKAGSAGRARAAPLWVYRVRPPARPPWRACGGTDRPRSRQLWAVGVAGAGAHRVAVAELQRRPTPPPTRRGLKLNHRAGCRLRVWTSQPEPAKPNQSKAWQPPDPAALLGAARRPRVPRLGPLLASTAFVLCGFGRSLARFWFRYTSGLPGLLCSSASAPAVRAPPIPCCCCCCVALHCSCTYRTTHATCLVVSRMFSLRLYSSRQPTPTVRG